VAAISYDSVEILRSFADRNDGFRYPLLADPDSRIIEAFGLRNPNPPEGSRGYGMAFPGTFVVDAGGIVQEKYFVQQHEQRYTAETVLLQTLGVGGGRRTEVQLPQFKFAAYASQDEIRPGNRVLLVVDIELPERMHLYAPGSDYTPADLRVIDDENIRGGRLLLPEAEIFYLEVIDESVPVYHDSARIRRELTLSPEYEGSRIEVPAVLEYQTCDDEICFPPGRFDLTFELSVIPHDRQRAPEDIRH
jgi:hypothetical protein